MLYLDPEHVKALSRKAYVLSEIPEGTPLPAPPVPESSQQANSIADIDEGAGSSESKDGVNIISAGGVRESLVVVRSALEILERKYARKYNAVEGKYNGVEATEAQQKEWDDLKAQMHDLEVIAQEKEDEAALRSVLEKERSIINSSDSAVKKDIKEEEEEAAVLPTPAKSENTMPPVPSSTTTVAAAKTSPKTKDSQFALLERLFETLEQSQSGYSALKTQLMESDGNGGSKGKVWEERVVLLNLCNKILNSPEDATHRLARVYTRTSGLLSRIVQFAYDLLALYTNNCSAEDKKDKKDKEAVEGVCMTLSTALHILSSAVRTDRAAKLLLMEASVTAVHEYNKKESGGCSADSSCCANSKDNKSMQTVNLLQELSTGLTALSAEQCMPIGLLYGYARLVYACVADDASTKARDYVYVQACI